MRILFPIYSFYPHHGGGPSLSVYWLTKSLVKEGTIVSVITSTNGLLEQYPIDQWNQVDGIQVQYCSNSFRFIRLCIHSISKADLIHLTSICYLPSVIIALWTSLFTRKPIIWSPRGELANNAILNNKAKKLLFRIYGIIFHRRVIFHGTSNKEIEEINRFFLGAKTVLLPNYIEMPLRLHNCSEHFLLYLGRISPIKSLDKLIIALSLSEKFVKSDFQFIIAGKAVKTEELLCESQLKKQIASLDLQNRIIFLGEVGGGEKDELLSRAYFSFLVSETENFGNVVVEAMAQGTPVVTSLGTPWAVLEDNNIGYHVSNEPSLLAETVDEILNMPDEEYQELRQRVYAFCVREYSITANIQKWIDVYDNMLHNSNTNRTS